MPGKQHFPEDFLEIKKIVKKNMQENTPNNVDNWTFESGGCETGTTWQRNIDAFQDLGFNIKTLSGVKLEEVDITKNILGANFSMPLMVAPFSAGINKICEKPFTEIARGCKATNIPASIGYPNGVELTKQMIAEGTALFRIIKPIRDRTKLKEELKYSKKSGCHAIGIDVDSMVGLKANGDKLGRDISEPVTVKELKELVNYVDLPFILKGIMSIEDAEASLETGAKAIVISTHTGSSLDYSLSPLEVLPRIKAKVGNRMEVFMDSGITRGSDALKALCLGADAVLIGRLTLWGLALGKAEGLKWIFQLMEKEIKRNMVFLGKNNANQLGPDSLLPLNNMGSIILMPFISAFQ